MLSRTKLARLQSGRPQWEVARETGIAPSRLSAIENERVVARPDELARIATALGVSMDLVGLPAEPRAEPATPTLGGDAA